MDTSGNSMEGTKRSPFDDLTKEELITKCKGLLAIAQKAKLAKTEIQNEVESYKLQIEKYETEKKKSLDSYKTLQELVDSLTEQKLNFITEVDSAQSKIKSLKGQCNNYEDEIKKYQADLIVKDQQINEITQKLSDIDCEVISLKRQNVRLTEENEQLISQLTEIEARTAEVNNIGLQQMEQLKILEQSVHTDEDYKNEIQSLNNKIDELQNKLTVMEQENNKQSEEHQAKFNEVSQLYETEKSKRDKAYVKLKSYKDKILKCAACINQLKNSRHILTKTVQEYSENIPKWQNDIIKASKVLDDQLKELNNENVVLKQKISELETKLNNVASDNNTEVLTEQIKEWENKNKVLVEELNNLRQQYNDIANNHVKLQNDYDKMVNNYKEIHEIEMPKQVERNKVLENQIVDNNKKIKELVTKIDHLTKVSDELTSENQHLTNSLKNNDHNNEILNNLNLQIKSLESEKSILVKEKMTARDSVTELENSNKILTSQVSKLTIDIQELKTQLDAAVKENTILTNKHKTQKDGEINILKGKLKEQQEQYNLLKKEFDDIQDLNNLLKEEVETLKFSLEQPKDDSENLSDLNVSLQADIVRLETKLSAYKQENASLLAEMKESRIRLKEFDALVAEYEETKSKLISYKSENSELLNEMKEINQVLKERGESISKQQKAIAEMERLIETLEKDRVELIDEKKETNKKIQSLENELKNAEIKSTENTGIVEEVIAERDAIKKQLEEKDEIIASLKEEIEKTKQHPSAAADLPNEDMSTSTISKAEDISRMKDLDETFEEKYTKLRIFALKLKKKLNETTTLLENTEQDKAKLEKKVEHLIKENASKPTTQNVSVVDKVEDGKQTEISELQDRINKLNKIAEKTDIVTAELEKVKAELHTKCQELAAEVEAHKITKENLEKARRDVKKKNVLSLEIEDYERSMKELTVKIEEKKRKMVQMESTIDTQESTITAMKTQIKLLEEQIKSEETQNRLTREELQMVIEESKNKEHVIQAKNEIISKLEQDLEDEKRKNEEADLEMTTVMSEKEKVIMNLAEDKAELYNKVKRLEFKCGELNEKLKIVNMELADLKTEYTSYKVRAQAVLRQNQTVDHSQEEQLKEEAAALKAQIESLTSKLSTVNEQYAEQTAELENARRRATEATNEATRAQQRTTRLHADLARLSQQLESERIQQKLQISTLTQCCKTQISELESKLQKEAENFKKQLMAAQETNNTKKTTATLDDSNQNQYMLPAIPKDDSDGEMDINVSMIPREEGEGSECAPSPPPGGWARGRSPVPLERLLEDGVSDDDAAPDAHLAPEHELADLRRRLHAQQQRVKHVTVLLSESERECARMAQLSELLKAELRRVRGTSHNAHNAEYMKNVTLKFLTLPSGDERIRLVPVLQKILTLTSEETQKIQAIAKGLDPNASKGWGSYLPWPGGSK